MKLEKEIRQVYDEIRAFIAGIDVDRDSIRDTEKTHTRSQLETAAARLEEAHTLRSKGQRLRPDRPPKGLPDSAAAARKGAGALIHELGRLEKALNNGNEHEAAHRLAEARLALTRL